MAVDPWGGFNQGVALLNDTFNTARAQDRQSVLDAQTAASARQQLAMGDISLRNVQRQEQNRKDALSAAADLKPGIRTTLYDQQGPARPVDNSAGISQREALAQKISQLRNQEYNPAEYFGDNDVSPLQPNISRQVFDRQNQDVAGLQAQMDAIPATAQIEGDPLPQVAVQEEVPITDADRQSAMAQSYIKNGAIDEAKKIVMDGGAITDMLAKMKAKTAEFGTPEQAAQFDAHIEKLGKLEDLMGKLRKADPSGGMLKQFITAHPEDFPGIDASKIGLGENGMVTWPVNQNGVQGIGYLDTDGKVKFQAANEHRNQTWSEPYESMVGGKKVLLQKSSTGETKQVSADQSTTVQNIIQAGKAGNGGAGGLSEQAVEDAAVMYNLNGVLPSGRNKDANAAIQNKAAELRRATGQSAAGVIANAGDMKALAETIKQQEKQVGSMGSFVKNIDKQVNRFEQISKDLGSADARLLNIPLRALRGKVAGSPLQAKVDMYLTEISSETGKLASGATGSVAELSQGAREKWEKIHDPNLSMADLLEVLKETRHAGAMRMDSVNEQLAETRQKRANVGTTTTPKQPTETWKTDIPTVQPVIKYFSQNASKHSQDKMVEQLKHSGWSEGQIGAAWAAYKRGQK